MGRGISGHPKPHESLITPVAGGLGGHTQPAVLRSRDPGSGLDVGTPSLSCHRTLTKFSIPSLASASICKTCGLCSMDITWSPRTWGQRAVRAGPRQALPSSALPGSADLEVRLRSPPSASRTRRGQHFAHSLHRSTYSSVHVGAIVRLQVGNPRLKSKGPHDSSRSGLLWRRQRWEIGSLDVGASMEGRGGRARPPGALRRTRGRGRLGGNADELASIAMASGWPRFCPLRSSPGFKAT